MKTATVRDLRNNFSRLAQLIEEGAQITITRNGKNSATFCPGQIAKWFLTFDRRRRGLAMTAGLKPRP